MKVPHDTRTLATHPCACLFCERTFAQVYALRQHEHDAHGIRPPKRRRQFDDETTEADWQTWMRL